MGYYGLPWVTVGDRPGYLGGACSGQGRITGRTGLSEEPTEDKRIAGDGSGPVTNLTSREISRTSLSSTCRG